MCQYHDGAGRILWEMKKSGQGPVPKGYRAVLHTENLLISGELSSIFFDGEVREWMNRPVSKTVSPQGHGGSNPPLSELLPGRERFPRLRACEHSSIERFCCAVVQVLFNRTQPEPVRSGRKQR